ncbi:NADH dehydrogenase subunit 6 [Tanacetum coccineum]
MFAITTTRKPPLSLKGPVTSFVPSWLRIATSLTLWPCRLFLAEAKLLKRALRKSSSTTAVSYLIAGAAGLLFCRLEESIVRSRFDYEGRNSAEDRSARKAYLSTGSLTKPPEGRRTMILSVLSSLTLVSSLMVVRAKNMVHSVLFPILVFRNTSGLLLLLGLDFFAMIFPVVYIGAIAVSFLFVVMMFHIFEEAAELDAVLSKSRDSQSSIFFSPENIRLREGFPSLLTSTDTDR